MRRYQFVVGMTLAALEEEVNRIVNNEPSTKLIQVFYAQGTGFVGVVEYLENTEVLPTKQADQSVNPRRSQEKSQKKS